MTARLRKGEARLVHKAVSEGQILTWLAGLNEEDAWREAFPYISTYGTAYYTEVERGWLSYYHAMADTTNARFAQRTPGLLELFLDYAREHLPAKLVELHDLSPVVPELRPRPYWSHVGVVRAVSPDIPRGAKQVSDKGGMPHLDLEGFSPRPESLMTGETLAYSFVLCMVKPAKGGNLRVWEGEHRRYNARTQMFADQQDYAKDKAWLDKQPSTDLHYTVGSMAMFDSLNYHRILPCTYTPDKDERTVAAIHFQWIPEDRVWEYWF